MWSPFGELPIHVCGVEPLVSQVVAGLRAGLRTAHPIAPAQLATLDPRRRHTLILADPPDAAALLADLLARVGRSTRRRLRPRWMGRTVKPWRVILMHPSDQPPPLPDLDPDGPLRIETFAIASRAVRALLGRWPLHLGLDPRFGQRPHLLIAGFAAPAQALLVHALRLIQYGDTPALVTLLCDDPAIATGLRATYPQAHQVAELRVAPLTPRPALQGPPVTLAVVCLEDPDGPGLDMARGLAETIAGQQGVSPPILLEVGEAQPRGRLDDWDGQIIPFSTLREACRAEVLLDGLGDELARIIQDQYRDTIAAQGRDPTREPAGQPWERLALSYRQANRHQADHLWAKLALTDCRAVSEEMVESFAFTPVEVEHLALIEHRRWAADRHLDGWSYAPVRDNARKHHPQLIPYAELSEPMKDLDRFAVRGVPNLLARSGLGVVRMLIVGVPTPPGPGVAGARLRRFAARALERLTDRYPDRALILAATLADPGTRQVVRQALDEVGAGLFLLLPQPIGITLAAQPDAAARRDLLALAVRAERRIGLAGADELARWFAERTEILLTLAGPPPLDSPAKRVTLDLERRRLDWNFEY